MRAAIVTRYGPPDVIEVREVPRPEPGPGEVLVRVRASTVNSGDARIRALRVPAGLGPMIRLQFGWSKPRQPVLGIDMAGDVEVVGPGVTAFRQGDRVLASRGFRFGCNAEFAVASVDGAIAAIPPGVSYADAVSLPFGGIAALYFFRAANLSAGQSVLINGASGAVGTMAVQIAKAMGAEVTAVCSAANVELVKGLGADRVVDYRRDDLAAGSATYDAIMDAHGSAPFARVRHMLKPGGKFLMVIGSLPQMVLGGFNKSVIGGDDAPAITAENYRYLMELVVAGRIRPVIDSSYPLADIVEAHRRVDSGRKVGAVVVTS